MSSDNSYDENLITEVGPWAEEKHERLRRYIDASRKTRLKYIDRAGATYIDLFCGTGRARIRGTNRIIDGSAVTAYKKSLECGVPFNSIHIGDMDPDKLSDCASHLRELGATVFTYLGPAAVTAQQAVDAVDPYGLNLAFIDPFNIETLHIDIFKALAQLKRIDIIAHFSAMDTQRNIMKWRTADDSPLDKAAPGWREATKDIQAGNSLRNMALEYWKEQIKALGIYPSDREELITGSKSQPLYWLVFIAKHNLADYFWNEIRNLGQRDLF